jgi:erythritol transport system substrate-binding protein
MAVNQTDRFLKAGSTGKPELQMIPCDLVTKENADQYANFGKIK